jgi:ATP-dependent Clp endopeptidase proteolytic subunit ClpP
VSKQSWYEFKASVDKKETQLFLYDEIGGFGVSAAQFVAELKQVPEDHGLVLRIHSPGGSVLEGQAIFTALRAHPGGITTHIDGLAASMASVVALAGNPVQMAGNGIMMIHNVSAFAQGDAEEMRKQADVMDKIQETIVSAYVTKTGLSKKKITELMDAETWMTASEAKELGFVDEITGDLKIAAKFDLSKFKNTARLTELVGLMSKPTDLPSEETLLQKLAALFTSTELKAKDDKIVELEGVISKNDEATEELVAAHTNAITAAGTESTDLKAKLATAESNSATPEEFEKKVNAEVTRRCAAIGIKEPIKRDPAVNTDEDLETVREQMNNSTDPKERADLARKARELRTKKAA